MHLPEAFYSMQTLIQETLPQLQPCQLRQVTLWVAGTVSADSGCEAAVVLVRDKNAVESMNLMNLLDSIRGPYAGRVEFLLVDYDTPQGRAFIAANHAAPITLVLFDAGGRQVKILAAPQTAANLQKEITNITGAKL